MKVIRRMKNEREVKTSRPRRRDQQAKERPPKVLILQLKRNKKLLNDSMTYLFDNILERSNLLRFFHIVLFLW